MTASLAAKSMCRGAEMKEATLQTEIIKAIMSTCLNADALISALGQSRYKVARALSGLVDRGLAERREKGCFAATKLGIELLAEHGFLPVGAPISKGKSPIRRRGTVRQRAWNVMRIQAPFTIQGVTALASKNEEDRAQSLPEWFLALERAGYIRREVRREPHGRFGGHGLVRYRLIKDTGMLAPVHSAKYGCIRDPNTGEDTPCQK